MDKKVLEFQTLMDEDEVGDLKSVYWDGQEARTVEDQLDDESISDGRNWRGFVPLEKELWKCNIYGIENYEAIFDENDHVLYKGDKYRFEVKKIENYASGYEKLSNEIWLKMIDEYVGPGEYKKQAVFRGIRTIDDKQYAGFVACYRDGYGNSYEISYMVNDGNMADANTMINQILMQFDINFDPLEYLGPYNEETEEKMRNG